MNDKQPDPEGRCIRCPLFDRIFGCEGDYDACREAVYERIRAEQEPSVLLGNAFAVRCVMAELSLLVSTTADENAPGYKQPMGLLLGTVFRYPQTYVDLTERIAKGEDVEYRINGAGLKLYAYDGRLRIGGDQARAYPGFVREANNLFRDKGVSYE